MRVQQTLARKLEATIFQLSLLFKKLYHINEATLKAMILDVDEIYMHFFFQFFIKITRETKSKEKEEVDYALKVDM